MQHETPESVGRERRLLTRESAIERLQHLKDSMLAMIPKRPYNRETQEGLRLNCEEIQEKIDALRAGRSSVLSVKELAEAAFFIDAYAKSLTDARKIRRTSIFG